MTNPHEGRPPHPRYGPPLGGAPTVWGGVTFRPYRAGIANTVRASDDFRITITTNRITTHTYSVSVDGVFIPGGSSSTKRFRYQRTAAEAGVKLLKQKGPQ